MNVDKKTFIRVGELTTLPFMAMTNIAILEHAI